MLTASTDEPELRGWASPPGTAALDQEGGLRPGVGGRFHQLRPDPRASLVGGLHEEPVVADDREDLPAAVEAVLSEHLPVRDGAVVVDEVRDEGDEFLGGARP